MQRWKDGEKLYLPKELETGIRQIQEEHNDDADDPIPGMIDEFLSIKLLADRFDKAFHANADRTAGIAFVELEH